jgi:hypothetical protein
VVNAAMAFHKANAVPTDALTRNAFKTNIKKDRGFNTSDPFTVFFAPQSKNFLPNHQTNYRNKAKKKPTCSLASLRHRILCSVFQKRDDILHGTTIEQINALGCHICTMGCQYHLFTFEQLQIGRWGFLLEHINARTTQMSAV